MALFISEKILKRKSYGENRSNAGGEMDLKEILGDAYREDMTAEEITGALKAIDVVDRSELSKYVPKATADKYASEAAAFKKQLREKQTEEEKKIEAEESLLQEIEALKRANQLNEYEKQFLAIGYEAELAQSTADALANGNTADVFKNIAKHAAQVEKKGKADALKSMNPPSAGNEGAVTVTKEQFESMTYPEKLELYNQDPELHNQLANE